MTKNLDQHFTPDSLACMLAESVIRRYDPYKKRTYLEPSVGEGAFVRGLMANGVKRDNIVTCDIDPEMEADHYGDFLEFDWGLPRDTITIGNPPFGSNGGLAMKFVDAALKVGDVCCFVMPIGRVYNQSMTSLDLGEVKFSDTNAKCVWAEFANYGLPRIKTTTICVGHRNLAGFEIVERGRKHDIVIQRCGGGLGRVTTCNGTGQGKWYIKIDESLSEVEKRRMLRAFQNLSKYLGYLPRPMKMTHQPSMNRQELLELVLMSYYNHLEEK